VEKKVRACVRARGLRVCDELLLIFVDRWNKTKIFRVSTYKETFFQKKNARLAREKEKKENEAFYKRFGTGRERTTE
jgi:hypothetical protein